MPSSDNDRLAGDQRGVSRRTVIKSAAAVASAPAIASLAVNSAGAQGTPAASGTPVPDGAIVSSVEGVPIAYTKYPEPFTSVEGVPGSGGSVKMLTLSYSPPPTPHDDNTFWTGLEERLGVEWEAEIVPISGYGEKIATVFAGGDLPDLFYLLPGPSRPVIYEAMDQGAFHDLTDFVMSDQLQEYPNLAALPSYLWDAVRVNGRVWGIPKPVLRNNDPTFYRKDFADTLGASLEDGQGVSDFLVGVSRDDPDGNGSADTYGLSPYGGAWDSFLINQMFRVPYGWRLNDDGSLTNAIETDEYKQALEYARNLYEQGAYHPDAANLTVEQSVDLMKAGRTGMASNGFAAVFGPTGFRATIKDVVPDAVLEPIVLPAFDGGPGVTYHTPGFFGLTAISAKAGQDEERLKELLRILDYLFAPFGSEEATFLNYGEVGVHSEEAEGGGYQLTEKGRADRSALVYPFLSENYFFYPGMPGEAEAAQKFNEEMAKVAISNPTAGIYSKAAAENGATLTQMVSDKYSEIVTGRAELADWDQLVTDWRSRGGDEQRKEYEEAIKNASQNG
ncbi:MAG TPA: extracellular solute-binding protein [Thermomicrobiales bacterium]|nr:extracellular solute-binding protein [Thermomicrobiales bacterium]